MKNNPVDFGEIEKKWFKRSLINGTNSVNNKSLANYSNSYNVWKRINGIRELFQQEIKAHSHSLRILDIGCGDALPLFILNSIKKADSEFIFYGIDISELDLFFAERLKNILNFRRYSFAISDVKCLPYKSNSFDIIICSEVLEHLTCPEECINEIHRVLKDDGVALLSTPNKNNLILKLAKPFRQFSEYSDEIIAAGSIFYDTDHDDHISVRSLNAWERTFKNAGFKVINTKRHAIFYGGYKYNRWRLLFAIVIIIDWLFDFMPFMKGFSEGITYKLSKK